ncbi:uncharacterized protein At1g10890-like [Nicotiana sylvestris]|uniref:uncharacterized protein At1g10890-like n=1 Tax=Nicotiana sylvestris TaxID=4096 RepID=UPI00388C5622
MDEPGSYVNETMYRGIIGSLLYLTTSRPDNDFSMRVCARFQSNQQESHLKSKQVANALHVGQRMRLTFAKSIREPGSLDTVLLGKGEPTEGPDPSAQEEPSSSSQVSTNPAPSPHFYAKPLSIEVPEMRSLSEEENEDSQEEDYDNMALASFISARSRKVTPKESTPKRPITRLQNKEELESVLKKNKEEKKKRRLVKDGKVMPPALVVEVDDEVEKEPGSLVRKSLKKESSVSEMGVSIVEGEKSSEIVEEVSGEKVVDMSGEKLVEESGERVVEESAEKVSKKSTDKGKSMRKSVKRKAGSSEEPGSSKKAKVGATQDVGTENLRNQKVLWGRTFASNILDLSGMRQLADIVEYQ